MLVWLAAEETCLSCMTKLSLATLQVTPLFLVPGSHTMSRSPTDSPDVTEYL